MTRHCTDVPKWDSQGRWARATPPVFGSEDWTRENQRQLAELETKLARDTSLGWGLKVFAVLIFLYLLIV